LGRLLSCILLLGFATAARRSELTALDTSDLVETHEGLPQSPSHGDGQGHGDLPADRYEPAA
jgi:hypothetical protein